MAAERERTPELLRAPFSASRRGGRGGGTPSEPPSDRPVLRLAVSRGTLAIELDAPFALGPIIVEQLTEALSGVRFPVDLSGGVTRFRHRRGDLARVELSVRALDLTRWMAPRLHGVLADRTPEVVLAPFEGGLLVGLRSDEAALAFELHVVPNEGDVRFVATRARAVGIDVPPHVLALRALAAAAPFGRIVGGALVVPDATGRLVRAVFPAAGARAPAVTGVRWEQPIAELGRFVLSARTDAPPPELTPEAIRALELAELTAPADDAAYAGDLDGARRAYLALLERAPRHREIAERLAWIDRIVGDRVEAALATLVEVTPATEAGALGGDLLARIGDLDGASAAYAGAAEAEPFGALAALLWMRAAETASDVAARSAALDEAVARAPALAAARWARLAVRLELADVRGAKADAEHLEAAAVGARERHAVVRRAAEIVAARGFAAEAAALFERALRYAPDDPEAVAGLARALRALGRDRRALDLLGRAAALAARANRDAHAVTLDLARGLAEVVGDLPAAIARTHAIPPGTPQSFEARRLEGRWRAELGDVAGATLAFARLRDAIDVAAPGDPDLAAGLAAMLAEAATFEERVRGDWLAAQRHLGVALRLRPRDRAIAGAFRRVADEAARGVTDARAERTARPELISSPDARVAAVAAAIAPHTEPEPERREPFEQTAVSLEDASERSDEAELEDETAVERLTNRLRADPSDYEAAIELAHVLERLGRDLDLLALTSARVEEGDERARATFAPIRRTTLTRLARAARDGGRSEEAALYEMMLASAEA